MTERRSDQDSPACLHADDPAPRFDATTRVADAVDADPGVVERLIALHPAFQLLRDPEQRAGVGRLVTLGNAADIVGVPLSDLLLAANARSPAACQEAFRDAADEPRPEWMERFDEAEAHTLDVRPMIGLGEEPFTTIMTAAAAVPDGGGLILDAPFNPLPLRRLLERKSFASYGQRLSEDHWRIFCRRNEGPGIEAPSRSDAHGARIWAADDGVHIDVRHLEAPAPLIAILSLVDGPEHGGVVTIHHKRDPLFLYPELAERGWSWSRIPGEPAEVRLLLRKEGG